MLPCDVSNRVSALKAQNAINFDILRRGFYEAWEKVNWRFARYTDAMITCVCLYVLEGFKVNKKKEFLP